MKKLRKQDRHRFDSVCEKIRETLKLTAHREHYSFRKVADDNDSVVGRCHIHEVGDFCSITIYDGFWEMDGKDQLKVLIHEHAHAVLAPLTQAYNMACGQFHPSVRDQVKDLYLMADERVTHHLESVLYDFLRSSV